MAKNKGKINIVHSWNLENFNRRTETLEFIKGKLHNLQLPMATEPSVYEKQINSLLAGIHEKQEAGEVPWFFILSDEPKLLNACSKVLPVSFALSTTRTVYPTSTDTLMRLFHQKPPMDDFAPDPRGDTIKEARTSGLLILDGVAETVAGANKYSGRFADLFLHRTNYDLPTVFTMFYDAVFTKKTWDSIKERISANIGATSAGIINRHISIVHFKTEPKTPTYNKIGV